MNILPYPRAQPQVPRKAANILRVQPQEEVIVMSPVSSLASGDRRECRETRLFIYSLNALEVGKLLRYAQLAYLQPASEAAIDGMYLNICVSENCITNSQNRAAI